MIVWYKFNTVNIHFITGKDHPLACLHEVTDQKFHTP